VTPGSQNELLCHTYVIANVLNNKELLKRCLMGGTVCEASLFFSNKKSKIGFDTEMDLILSEMDLILRKGD